MSQMGGILGWHWLSLSSSGAEDWTVEVLHSGCRILFHHLSPVVREPVKFPSYDLGSAKAQALEGEVDKMLQDGAVERVHQPGQGFYSRLFLV